MIFRSLSASPWILGVPHGASAPGTLEAAVAVFAASQARVLVVSATHRCASETPSECGDGSSACGEEPAPISDMARSDASVFHHAHDFWSGEFPGDRVATFAFLDDDGLSLSDGTVSSAASGSAVQVLAAAVAASLPGEDATSCNADAGLPQESRACGTDDLQGRLLNLEPGESVCTERPQAGLGRYVHLAAEADLLGPATPLVDVFAAVP